jgi:hypothetical protein
VTSILENSKVIIALAFRSDRPSASVIPPLLTPGPAGAIVNHVTAQCQDQGRLLEEAKCDPEVFKKAYYKAERDMHDREERFEREKQALNDEIRELRVRAFLSYPRDVNGYVFPPSIQVILIRENRASRQLNPPSTPTNTRQHAMVYGGTKTA